MTDEKAFWHGGVHILCKDVEMFYAPKITELSIRLKDGRIVHEAFATKKEAMDKMYVIQECFTK